MPRLRPAPMDHIPPHHPPGPAHHESHPPGNPAAPHPGDGFAIGSVPPPVPLHKVLAVETITIPIEGYIQRSYGQAFASVTVTHHGASVSQVTVMAGQAVSPTAPAIGRTVGKVDCRATATFAISDHVLSIWGAFGDVITIQVFSDVKPPVATSPNFTAYTSLIPLADQAGANAVLSFNFPINVSLIVIEGVGAGLTARASVGVAVTPTASFGLLVHDSSPIYVPVWTSVVRVWTPTGMTVTVAGYLQ